MKALMNQRFIFGILLCSALFAFTITGFAQTQQLAANVTAESVTDADKSASDEKKPAAAASNTEAVEKPAEAKTGEQPNALVERNKDIENPATKLWLLQTQQNNTQMAMPLNKGNYYRHTFEIEPLMPIELSRKWTMGFRPVLPFVSQPYPVPNMPPTLDPSTGTLKADMHRMTSLGDMTLGMGVNPQPSLVHNWIIVNGVTFIFPTATHDILGQKNWQAGPLNAVGKIGTHYLTYVLQQTWWKIGGDGQRTRQTWVRYMYNYNFSSGWLVGTMSDMLVNWQADRDQRVAFPIGPQVGKLVHIGALPTQIAVSAQYYAVRPSNLHSSLTSQTVVPKWNFQLMLTPIVPSIQAIIKHQIPEDPTRKKS